MQNGWDRATILTAALAALFALLIGGTVGFIATFTHRQAAPWGLIAGLWSRRSSKSRDADG